MDKAIIETIFHAVRNRLDKNSGLKMMKEHNNYCNFNFYTKCCVLLVAALYKTGIRITLYIEDNDQMYDYLLKNKNEIHNDFSEDLQWEKVGKNWKIYNYIENEGYIYKNPNEIADKIINELIRQKDIYLKYLP